MAKLPKHGLDTTQQSLYEDVLIKGLYPSNEGVICVKDFCWKMWQTISIYIEKFGPGYQYWAELSSRFNSWLKIFEQRVELYRWVPPVELFSSTIKSQIKKTGFSLFA